MSKNSFDGKNFMKELLSNELVEELSGELLSNEFLGNIFGGIVEAVGSTKKKTELPNKPIENIAKNKEKSNKKSKSNKEKNKNIAEKNKTKEKNSNLQKQEVIRALNKRKMEIQDSFLPENITEQKLREAIVWSEVLGEPACRKRRNRR